MSVNKAKNVQNKRREYGINFRGLSQSSKEKWREREREREREPMLLLAN
jgi:hypothetical protein